MPIIVILEWIMTIVFILLQISTIIFKFKTFVTKMSPTEKERYSNNISDVYLSLTILIGLVTVLITFISFIINKLYNQIPTGV